MFTQSSAPRTSSARILAVVLLALVLAAFIGACISPPTTAPPLALDSGAELARGESSNSDAHLAPLTAPLLAPAGSWHVASFDAESPNGVRLAALLRAAEVPHSLLHRDGTTQLHVSPERAWDARGLLFAAMEIRGEGATWIRLLKLPAGPEPTANAPPKYEMVCGHSERELTETSRSGRVDVVYADELVSAILVGLDFEPIGVGSRSVQESVPAGEAARARDALWRAQKTWERLQAEDPDRFLGWLQVVDGNISRESSIPIVRLPTAVGPGRVRVAVETLYRPTRVGRPLLALQAARCSPVSQWIHDERLGDVFSIDVPGKSAARAQAVLTWVDGAIATDARSKRTGTDDYPFVASERFVLIKESAPDALQRDELEPIARLPVRDRDARGALQLALATAPASWFVMASAWGETVWAPATDASTLRTTLREAEGHETSDAGTAPLAGDYIVIERRE